MRSLEQGERSHSEGARWKKGDVCNGCCVSEPRGDSRTLPFPCHCKASIIGSPFPIWATPGFPRSVTWRDHEASLQGHALQGVPVDAQAAEADMHASMGGSSASLCQVASGVLAAPVAPAVLAMLAETNLPNAEHILQGLQALEGLQGPSVPSSGQPAMSSPASMHSGLGVTSSLGMLTSLPATRPAAEPGSAHMALQHLLMAHGAVPGSPAATLLDVLPFTAHVRQGNAPRSSRPIFQALEVLQDVSASGELPARVQSSTPALATASGSHAAWLGASASGSSAAGGGASLSTPTCGISYLPAPQRGGSAQTASATPAEMTTSAYAAVSAALAEAKGSPLERARPELQLAYSMFKDYTGLLASRLQVQTRLWI